MRARDVVFVDGVRTPFGKSGPKGIYAETRADDMVVRVIRELMRRNPDLPPERVGEVAVAAGEGLTDILGAHREIGPVLPRLVLDDGRPWLEIPDGVEYPL